MKNFIRYFIVLFLFSFAPIKIYSQETEIKIDSIFNSSFELFLFEQIENISGITVDGDVQLNSDTSLVRVILEDDNGIQYMILETYPLICPGQFCNYPGYCDETCFLEQVNPNSIIIQVIDATLNLKSFYYSTDPKENATEQRFQAKRSVDEEKIEMMNQLIPSYNMNWVAGDNTLVAMYFEQKRSLFGDEYNLRGFDYYVGGVFETLGHGTYPKADPDLVKTFDWRDRHGANDSLSLYWVDGNLSTGWLTSVKNQGSFPGCYAFGPASVVEALANIYSNQFFDYDLSEQYVISCCNYCSSSSKNSLAFIKDSGCILESCFPYDTTDWTDCSEQCENPIPVINFTDTLNIPNNNQDSIRIALIKYGPLLFRYTPTGSSMSHSAALSGYQFNITDSTISWIIKNSWGVASPESESGFYIMPITDLESIYAAIGPVRRNDTALTVHSYDKDGDSLCFWGIGLKPGDCPCSSDIEDCDDNDSLVGGYDENYNCTCLLVYDSIPEYITVDTIWEDTVYIAHVIIVDSGACLTIKSVALFNSQAKIIVKQGGKLIIDEGKLTNACPNELWEGIEAWGSDTNQYFYQYFGVVNISNGGTIENARTAIANYCKTCNYNDLQSGGVIRTENATFRNNRIAIDFAPFRNEWQGQEQAYRATFSKSIFEHNEYLNDYSDFKYFIKMQQVNGIKIYGCDFTSDTTNIHFENEIPNKYRTGIYSIGSQFYVDGQCISQTAPCTLYKSSHFSGLNYGIYALGIDGTETVSVKKSCFDHNRTGIYLSAINYATIVRDTFNVNNTINQKDTLCGLYLDYCTGYKVEENFFHGNVNPFNPIQSSVKRIGLAVNNSGEMSNQIYNNAFDSLFIGTLPMNSNRSENGFPGLQIKCNDYTNCYYDISVKSEFSGRNMGIAYNQGSGDEEPTSPANNTFSYTHRIEESDYKNVCQNIVYWHLKDTTSANTKPKYYSIQKVNPQYNGDYYQEYIKDTCCPSSFITGGGSILENKILMDYSESQVDSIKSLLDILIDGGDTYQLTNEIKTSSSEDSYQLSEVLLSHSPYLSDSVMITSIEKENVLTPAMITSILSANSQAAKSDTIQRALDDRIELLTNEQRTDIDQGWFISNTKERMEASYSICIEKKERAFNDIIRILKTDTLILNAFDSIVTFYTYENSIHSACNLSLEYLNARDTLAAKDILAYIPQNFDLSNNELIKYQQYDDFVNVIINSGCFKGKCDLDSTSLLILNSIASSGICEINAMARNVLISSNDLNYFEPYLFPEPEFKSDKIKRLPIRKVITENSLLLYPNPAVEYVIVEYSLNEPVIDGTLKVFDLVGKLYQFVSINKSKEYLLLSTHDLPNGVYIIQLFTKNTPLISKKLIIAK